MPPVNMSPELVPKIIVSFESLYILQFKMDEPLNICRCAIVPLPLLNETLQLTSNPAMGALQVTETVPVALFGDGDVVS